MKLNDLRNPKLSYWLGLVQSDGYLDVKRKTLRLECKSLKLAQIFMKIARKNLSRNPKILKRKTRNAYIITIGIGKLQTIFKNLSINLKAPLVPPPWIYENLEFFGAYLAGIIDGDGNVQIRRPKYPQCAIRIVNGKQPNELAKIIRKTFNCGVNISKQKKANYKNPWFVLEFYVSSKNYKLIKKLVIPWIVLGYKKNKLKEFIKFITRRESGSQVNPARLSA